ncbi:MAG: hypothetical protein ACYC7F_13485 [Gemmatimonadaceae bacterium]
MRHAGLRRFPALALLVVAAGCRSPAADAAVAEQLAQMSDAIIAMQDQMAVLSTTVDSLARVSAKQDTLMRQLAVARGDPVP